MGLDYGEARIGVALSDLSGTIATPLTVYKQTDQTKTLNFLTDLAKKNEVDAFIVGLPVNMDGTEGPRAVKTRQFGQQLTEFSNIPVVYCDERLTSLDADDILKESGMPWQQRKLVVDKVAAGLILQSYLDVHKKK